MTDFRTYSEKKRGWWIEARSTIPCILPKDGLLAVFLRKDIEEFMDKTYPTKGQGEHRRWYFNNTFDREIAEIDGDRIVCNPRVLQEHFLAQTLGKSISLINEPHHQRFWLPNRDYIYDMELKDTPRGQVWRHHIIHNETQRIVEFVLEGKISRYFDVAAHRANTGRLNLYAQELGAKRYPRPERRDKLGRKEKDKVVYNVVNVLRRDKTLMEHTSFLHQAQQFKAVQVLKYPGNVFEIVEITKEG